MKTPNEACDYETIETFISSKGERHYIATKKPCGRHIKQVVISAFGEKISKSYEYIFFAEVDDISFFIVNNFINYWAMDASGTIRTAAYEQMFVENGKLFAIEHETSKEVVIPSHLLHVCF